MSGKGDHTGQIALTPPSFSVTQDYMEKFLVDIRQEICSLKTDFKSCLNDLRKDVTAVRESKDALKRIVGSRSEDQEEFWRRLNALEEQHIKLQTKQKDLENGGCRNNLGIRGIPCGAEEEDIMSFTRVLLGASRDSMEREPQVLDRAYRDLVCLGPIQALALGVLDPVALDLEVPDPMVLDLESLGPEDSDPMGMDKEGFRDSPGWDLEAPALVPLHSIKLGISASCSQIFVRTGAASLLPPATDVSVTWDTNRITVWSALMWMNAPAAPV
ncbi:hypothetical protein NDU88_003129 [Pleurodeles waltl]|uniref:Uncharacterized protein n=1 Tax=Pleurodeles waltl TaxID=8319 RepID=A0AAV7T432_PLEWA|nr:hypothetical protein NDU88_003129 [Pleurodeles waltl]